MDLSVLGPLMVRDGRRAIEIGAARQRRLLCALLFDADETVTVDTLLERVWDDAERPDQAVRALRTYLSRLRTALPRGDRFIETTHNGYVARLTGHEVDALRAATLRRELNQVGPEDPAAAVALADRALQLWRGRPFDDVADLPWAAPEVQRLEELRRSIEDERLDALLACGRAADAVVDLQRAIANDPLRERRQGQLMVALDRCGRRADALRAFERYRALLATETGLEPGEPLRVLEQRILAGGLTSAGSPPGRALHSYVLGPQLGEGAFSLVWQATQPSVGREVAIKQIRAEFANRPEFVRRFEAEAHLVARLEHRHIVPLYDYWREPEGAYLVMRWFRRGTLQDRIDREGPLPLEACALLARELGGALAAAHRAGVVHRDVKPGNVFCDEEGHFYLGDFGIALDATQAVEPEATLSAGSPAYASPEQLRREPVGPAADVHALGITLFEALTGRIPFPDERNQASLLQRQLHDPVPSARALRASVPVAVDAVIAKATAKGPADRYATVEDFVDAIVAALAPDGGAAVRTPARHASTVIDLGGANPYKGLRAFTEADAGEFFGRDRLVAELLGRLCLDGPDGRMLTVVGPSGSGKSSLVRAGLVPALRRGAVEGSGRWFITSMVPSAHPFEELEVALLRVAVNPPDRLLDQLTDGPRGVARAVKRAVGDTDGDLVVIVDQFEELFTLCEDADERRRFLIALAEAVRDPQARMRLVLTLRADFYDRPLRQSEIAPLVKASAVTVTPLAPDELERAIVEPAERVGAALEPGLVAQIVADLADRPGALPLLQYALTELYERRISGMLTTSAYRDLGGLAGALARRADELTDGLDEIGQLQVRRLFGRLVALGEGSEDTRRRVLRADLGSVPGELVDRFGAARLLSFDQDPASREPTVEVAHEALIRQWPRLRAWLEEDREALRVHRHLAASAAGWEASGRDRGELYRGGRLEVAEQWWRDNADEPSPSETAFIEASVAQRAAELDAAERGHRRVRRALVGVAVVAAVAVLAGALAFQQRGSARSAAAEAAHQRDAATASAEEALRERASAETGRLAALAPTLVGTDLSLSMLLAAEGAQRRRDPETLGALQQVLVAADANLGFIATDHPLRHIAFAGTDRVVGFTDTELIVWDAQTRARRWALPLPAPLRGGGSTNAVRADVVDGRAAWVDTSGVAYTVGLEEGAEPVPVGRDAIAVAVAPAGDRLAVADADGALTLVSADGRVQWTVPGDPATTVDEQTAVDLGSYPQFGLLDLRSEVLGVHAVAFAPGGRRLVHADGVLLHEVDVASGTRLATADTVHEYRAPVGGQAGPSHTWSAARLSFTSDQPPRLVASASLAVSTYDVEGLVLHSRFVPRRRQWDVFPRSVRATVDGRLAIVDTGGEVTLVDGADGTVEERFSARVGLGNTMATSPDGRQLVIGGAKGAVFHALDGSGAIRTAVPRRPEQIGFSAARDGATIISEPHVGSTEPGLAQTWACAPGPEPCRGVPYDTVFPTDDFGHAIRWYPNELQEMQVLDASGAPLSPRIVKDANGFGSAIVDPHGGWFAFDNQQARPPDTGTIQVNAVVDGARLATYPVPVGFAVLSTPPSGRFILAGNKSSGESFVIDTTTWEQRSSGLPAGAVVASTFSRDGRHLVTVDLTGRLTLRDPETFAVIRDFQADVGVGNSVVGPAAFSDDGRYLVSALDGRGRLWDVDTGRLVGQPIESLPDTSPSPVPGEHAGFVNATERWVQYWRFDPDSWPATACRLAGRNLTRAEWDQFGPRDQPYHATCPQWPAA